jgi:hypothetical protein
MSPAGSSEAPSEPPLLKVAWDGDFRCGWLIGSATGFPESIVDQNATDADIAKVYDLIISPIGTDRVQRDLYSSKRMSRHLLLRVRLLLHRRNFGILVFKFYVRDQTIEHRSYRLAVCPTQMEAEIETESLKHLFKWVHTFPPGKRAEILSSLRELYDRLVGRVFAELPSEHYELHSDDPSCECD